MCMSYLKPNYGTTAATDGTPAEAGEAAKQGRQRLIDGFCCLSGYHHRHAIALFSRPEGAEDQPRRRMDRQL